MSFNCARVQQKHGGLDLMDALVALTEFKLDQKNFIIKFLFFAYYCPELLASLSKRLSIS